MPRALWPSLLALAAAACGPGAPWIDLVGAAECVHQIAREPAVSAPQMHWEPGCPGDEIAGCERLVIAFEDGRIDGVHVPHEPLMVLTYHGEVPTGAYYSEDGRALMMERTVEGPGSCRAQLAFGAGRAALLSTGGGSLGFAPAVFSAPFPGAAGWAGVRPVYGERTIRDAVFAPLADGRVALAQSDTPEVFVADATGWTEVMRANFDAIDAAIVGDQVAVLGEHGELRIVALAGGAPTVYHPENRAIGQLRGDGERLYWLEAPAHFDLPDAPTTLTVELRAAPLAAGQPLAPRVLASFPHLRYSGLFYGTHAFRGDFHSSGLPQLGLGPGGLFVHVARDGEDLLILARPAEGKAWAWTLGKGRRKPGLGPPDSEVRPDKRPEVDELRSVIYVSERWLAVSYAAGTADIRRYPLAGFLTDEAALTP